MQRHIPLDADGVNTAMDELEGFGDAIRTVINPEPLIDTATLHLPATGLPLRPG